MTIAKVALDVPLPQLFDYRCPENQEAPQVGHRVIVPFGARRATGVVVALSETADIAHERLKDIERVLAERQHQPAMLEQVIEGRMDVGGGLMENLRHRERDGLKRNQLVRPQIE